MTAAAIIPPLHLAPHMPRAACAGRWREFDPAGVGEHPRAVERRHSAAQAACAGCPERARCETWWLGLPKSKRPEEVTAGHIWQPTAPGGKPIAGRRGRPRKAG
jgi:hypothetical protein